MLLKVRESRKEILSSRKIEFRHVCISLAAVSVPERTSCKVGTRITFASRMASIHSTYRIEEVFGDIGYSNLGSWIGRLLGSGRQVDQHRQLLSQNHPQKINFIRWTSSNKTVRPYYGLLVREGCGISYIYPVWYQEEFGTNCVLS